MYDQPVTSEIHYELSENLDDSLIQLPVSISSSDEKPRSDVEQMQLVGTMKRS